MMMKKYFTLLFFTLSVALPALAQNPYESSADFGKYSMKLREQGLKVEPQVFIPTDSPSKEIILKVLNKLTGLKAEIDPNSPNAGVPFPTRAVKSDGSVVPAGTWMHQVVASDDGSFVVVFFQDERRAWKYFTTRAKPNQPKVVSSPEFVDAPQAQTHQTDVPTTELILAALNGETGLHFEAANVEAALSKNKIVPYTSPENAEDGIPAGTTVYPFHMDIGKDHIDLHLFIDKNGNCQHASQGIQPNK